MKKINIDKDKLEHFLVGSVLALLTTLFVSAFNQNSFAIIFTGAFASVGWELVQGQFKIGKAELYDALWSFAPFVFAFIMIIIK